MASEPAAQVRVRPLAPADVPAFLDLIDALADYERLERPDPAARARLTADAVAEPPRFETLLAEVDSVVVGYAVYFMTYSTFLARPTLYLEDIFVLPAARGRGAGRRLFEACAAEAVRRGSGRMEWVVLDWNAPAIEFYRRRGARQMNEWLPFRLEGAALQAFAAPESAPETDAEAILDPAADAAVSAASAAPGGGT